MIITISLQFSFWFAPKNLHQLLRLNEKIAAQEKTNAQLKKRNTALYASIHNLKTGHDLIEEKARRELGMIKQGETLFLLKHTNTKNAS